MRNEKLTPLYERLSRDDELQGESNSIYARRNGFPRDDDISRPTGFYGHDGRSRGRACGSCHRQG